MRPKKTFALLILSIGLAISAGLVEAQDWLRFRGNDGSGVSQESESTVTKFDDKKNMLWKIELPGLGASSPVIVGDRVIVSCYSGYGISRTNPGDMNDLKRHVACYDKRTGNKIWQRDLDSVLPEDPFSGMGVPEHGYASGTPVSDGKHVFTFFGKTGVIAFDLDGNQIWKKSVGTSSGRRRWGSAASPVVHGDIVIVNASDEDNSLVALNKATGQQVWKNSDITNVWSTPLVVGEGEDADLVFSVPYEVWGLNPKNGKLKWVATNGVQDNSVSTSPVFDSGTIIAMGGRSANAVAIRLGGEKGADVTKTHTVWEGRSTGRIVSPVIYKGHLYGVSKGIATCLNAMTGEAVYKERLPNAGPIPGRDSGGRRGRSSDYNSPVAADGKIYQFTKTGTCYVLAAKPEFELLAVNQLVQDGSEFNSTPAISEGKLYVRSNKYLYCIGEK